MGIRRGASTSTTRPTDSTSPRNATVEDSYLTDPYSNGKAHPDGFQSTGGANIVIRHNHVHWGDNSGVLLKTDFDPISGVVIDANLFDGTGHYLLYSRVGDAANGSPTNVSLTNDVFGRGYQYGVTSINGTIFAHGNTWQDNGVPIAPGDPGGFVQS